MTINQHLHELPTGIIFVSAVSGRNKRTKIIEVGALVVRRSARAEENSVAGGRVFFCVADLIESAPESAQIIFVNET